MKAYNTNIYPVFEADQVLSQKELNQLVSHLEEQDRIIRKNLTGIGIVCGLELSFPTINSVKIGCGTAVTSLGFQINWEEKMLSNYHEAEISDQFLKPDYSMEPYLETIFKHSKLYEPIKQCTELLTADSNVLDKKPIPEGFFLNKAVVLLLEVTLINIKNCVTTNCDDKGKRLEFIIRPILVPVNDLTKTLVPVYKSPLNYSKIVLPRYNVPYQKIATGIEVLTGFEKIYTFEFITKISDTINSIYQDFKPILPAYPEFAVLQNAKVKIDKTVNLFKSSINVQYLWDWISDIAQAFNEITEFERINQTLCCIDERLFPFHVVLGTNEIESTTYRTSFYKTLNATAEENLKLKKLILLFERLTHLINSFKIDISSKIKVTPSVYGDVALSGKSIPFYYDEVLALNKKWNPEMTLKNQNSSILSYHSDKPNYTDLPAVQKPLLFDIEPYNFFRIEGHIGKNYKNAIKVLNLIKDSYALPLKITALNAVDFLNKEVDILKFEGRWDDLETDYDLARKRVYNITEFVFNWMDLRRNALDEKNIISKQNIDNFKNILSELKKILTNDLKEFLPNYISFYEIFKQLNYVFLFHRWCIQLQNPTLSALAEDLIDRMDDVNELFLDDPFTVIYEEANLRWQKNYKDLFFSTFLKKHPGIDHKAGVTKGGTFVLVYVDSSIFKASAPPLQYLNLLNAVIKYKNNIPIEASIKDELINSVQFKDYKSQVKVKPRTDTIDKCKEESDNIKNSLLEIAKYNLDTNNYTAEMSGFILENIKGAFQYELGSIVQSVPFQQTIIADFFLPYVCCSDGNTIEVKLGIQESLYISLDELKYCQTDEKEYEVKLKGKFGGTFTGTAKDAIIIKSDKYYLVPNHGAIKAPKIYTIQYEAEGELSNTVEFEIVAPAVLKWTQERDENNPNVFHFKNTNNIDTHKYEFNFGDESNTIITKENSITHTFMFDESNRKITVTIKQLGEVCENSQEIVVKIIGDFKTPDFNKNDFITN